MYLKEIMTSRDSLLEELKSEELSLLKGGATPPPEGGCTSGGGCSGGAGCRAGGKSVEPIEVTLAW